MALFSRLMHLEPTCRPTAQEVLDELKAAAAQLDRRSQGTSA